MPVNPELQGREFPATEPYLVGREKIFALREKYKARDPEHFTLKRFHEDLLSHGTIVPALIAEEMFAPK